MNIRRQIVFIMMIPLLPVVWLLQKIHPGRFKRKSQSKIWRDQIADDCLAWSEKSNLDRNIHSLTWLIIKSYNIKRG